MGGWRSVGMFMKSTILAEKFRKHYLSKKHRSPQLLCITPFPKKIMVPTLPALVRLSVDCSNHSGKEPDRGRWLAFRVQETVPAVQDSGYTVAYSGCTVAGDLGHMIAGTVAAYLGHTVAVSTAAGTA